MYKKTIVHHIAKWAIEIGFYLGILGTLISPFITDDVMKYFDYHTGEEMVYTVSIFTSGVFAVCLLFCLRKMYKTLFCGNPFVDENVKAFRRIAVCGFLISVIYLVKCFFSFTLSSLTISIIFMIACLFALTLKDLFKQAVNYKDENDLTI